MIDILLATYNGEAYIEEQLRSILAQSFVDWRLLVHDDGSTDHTIAIVEQLAREDARIILIRDDVKGQGAARHFIYMLQYVEADFCMFCDQDDIWLPDKIEKMYEAIAGLDQGIPQVVYSNAYLWRSDAGIISNRNTLTYPTTLRQALFLNSGVQGAAAIFNQSACGYLRQPLTSYAMHDHVLLLVAICLGRVNYLDEPLMYYRQHENNVTGHAPGSMRRKIALMWQNRQVPVVSRSHLDGLRAFFVRFHRELSSGDSRLIEVFLQLPDLNFLDRLKAIIANRFQLYDSTLLLIVKLCIRRFI